MYAVVAIGSCFLAAHKKLVGIVYVSVCGYDVYNRQLPRTNVVILSIPTNITCIISFRNIS